MIRKDERSREVGIVTPVGIHNAVSVCVLSFSCETLLKSSVEAQAHATRTGHSNFSESTEEIKPLTEEEKKAKLAE